MSDWSYQKSFNIASGNQNQTLDFTLNTNADEVPLLCVDIFTAPGTDHTATAQFQLNVGSFVFNSPSITSSPEVATLS